MLTDQQMIALMVSEPSWEDVIVKIVAEEGMDPWSIDIIKLADAFTSYVKKLGATDLKVPARFILIAAILLRMKSDAIAAKEERVLIPESPENPEQADLLRALASIPPLQPPIKRIPLKNVTLNELIVALRKAFEVKDRRIQRKFRVQQAVALTLGEEEDITERINKLLEQIKTILMELETGKVEFSKLVKEWKRDEIVETLMPLLYLSQEGKITYEQPEPFKEIYVEVKENIHEREEK